MKTNSEKLLPILTKPNHANNAGRLISGALAILAAGILAGCAALSEVALNDEESRLYNQGNALIRLEVSSDADQGGSHPYDKAAKRLLEDKDFLDAMLSYRMVPAVGRVSFAGLSIKGIYFFIDDRVPELAKGDIVDVLMPKFDKDNPETEAVLNKKLMNGKGATVVRLVCRAKDEACKSRNRNEIDKLTGVIFFNPEKEGWPGDMSTTRVTPRSASLK